MKEVALGAAGEDVEAVGPPRAGGRVRCERATERLPRLPAGRLVPAVPQRAIPATREQVDPVGAPRAGRRVAGELAAHRLPAMPGSAVPVPIPQLAVVEDGEHLHLVLRP